MFISVFSASLLHYASSIEYQKKYERATIISEDNMLNSVIWNIIKNILIELGLF